MVKIKISYNTDAELEELLKLIAPILRKYKVSKNRDGNYKKAYAELEKM